MTIPSYNEIVSSQNSTAFQPTGASSFYLKYSTSTSMGDPGTGVFRTNAALNQPFSTTQMVIDKFIYLNSSLTNVQDIIALLGINPKSKNRLIAHFRQAKDPTKFFTAKIISISLFGGYVSFTLQGFSSNFSSDPSTNTLFVFSLWPDVTPITQSSFLISDLNLTSTTWITPSATGVILEGSSFYKVNWGFIYYNPAGSQQFASLRARINFTSSPLRTNFVKASGSVLIADLLTGFSYTIPIKESYAGIWGIVATNLDTTVIPQFSLSTVGNATILRDSFFQYERL